MSRWRGGFTLCFYCRRLLRHCQSASSSQAQKLQQHRTPAGRAQLPPARAGAPHRAQHAKPAATGRQTARALQPPARFSLSRWLRALSTRIYTEIHIYVHIFIYLYIHIHIYINIQIYAYIHIRTYIQLYIYIVINIYIDTHVYLLIYVYIYVYIYIRLPISICTLHHPYSRALVLPPRIISREYLHQLLIFPDIRAKQALPHTLPHIRSHLTRRPVLSVAS